MNMLRRYADNRQSDSMAAQLRRKRFALFESLIAQLPRPLRILDVGGEERFWEIMGFTDQSDIEIVLLNLAKTQVSHSNFRSVAGDATHMREYSDGEFDIVFSNSVIEHVGGFADQYRMGQEIQRVGKRYFVQTPNRYFPIEPHFLFPFFQFLPFRLKLFLAYRFQLGWYGRGDRAKVTEAVRSIRLLSRREVRRIFPDAVLYKERFWGLTKSFIVYAGWER